tara:strand:- start:2030 stop:2248 length:219 start_codon:yes stop_codon:yes gene_type:complete
MLTCLVIAGSLWIGDMNILYPTQGAFYFHKFQQTVRVYESGGRMGAFVIPKSMDAPTLGEVFENCSKEKRGD